jgi:uncharacterized MAPEG superfamily protein
VPLLGAAGHVTLSNNAQKREFILEYIEPYKVTVLIMGLTGLVSLIQLLIVDFAAIKLKHTPGFPVLSDHSSFLFRASRAHADTNETIGAFILLSCFGVLSSGSAAWLNGFAIAYFVGRILHMCCYYGGLSIARSASFAVSLVGLTGMFVIGLAPWF